MEGEYLSFFDKQMAGSDMPFIDDEGQRGNSP
jgi:hypothetical protein